MRDRREGPRAQTLRTDDPSYVGPIRLLGKLGAAGWAAPSCGQDAVDERHDLLLGAGQQLWPVVASVEQQDLLVTRLSPDGVPHVALERR